jgi:hypothetical protein
LGDWQRALGCYEQATITLENLPGQVPYLRVPPQIVVPEQRRLDDWDELLQRVVSALRGLSADVEQDLS